MADERLAIDRLMEPLENHANRFRFRKAFQRAAEECARIADETDWVAATAIRKAFRLGGKQNG